MNKEIILKYATMLMNGTIENIDMEYSLEYINGKWIEENTEERRDDSLGS